MRIRWALATLVLVLVAPPAAHGASLRLTSVGSFDQPVYVTAPPQDPHRLFVVEQTGRIMVVRDGGKLATPFLDLSGQVSGGAEQGLLSMAFAPDYATSGRFYVDYTDTHGDTQVVEYRRAANPDRADPATARPVLFQAQPQENHNGGQLQFGPDGYLYIGLGDGGNGDDVGAGHNPTIGNGQDLTTLLGKILRIDPRHGSPYAIPPGNPFATGPSGAKPEIWDYGLRNPWRFSFDPATGELWIGDVGQDAWEEVDHEPRGAGGRNYGWRRCEGSHLFDPADAGNPSQPACTVPGLTGPVTDYPHSGARCSITGGYLVRDPTLSSLAGAYVYADFCTGEIWALRPPAAPQKLALSLPSLTSFGEDSCGHLYAASLDGRVMVFQEDATRACPTGSSAPPPLGALALRATTRRRVSRSGRVTLRISCPAAARVACTGQVRLRHGSRLVAHAAFRVRPGDRRRVRARLIPRARRQLARRGRLSVRVTASGRDADRALSAARARVSLRRP